MRSRPDADIASGADASQYSLMRDRYEWHPRAPNLWERIGAGIFLAAFLTAIVNSSASWRLFGDYDDKAVAGLGLLGLVLFYRVVHMVRRC